MSLTNQQPKPAFSIRTFRSLMTRLDADFPDMDVTRWQDVIADAFALTPVQVESINSLSGDEASVVQGRFAEIAKHSRAGGLVRGKIVKQPDGSHIALVFLEVANEGVETLDGALSPERMLPIVCCDATCGDWDWGCNG